jgi:molybdenum cofactor guanylyltransferase
MESIAGFILSGGESRRMGTDKAQLLLNGQSFVERIAKEITAATPLVLCPVTLVGDLAAGTKSNLPTARDIYPRWGALGGVHAALSASAADWALVVACDFPFVTKELFVRLASLRERFEAVAPVQKDLVPQPLCALYRVEPCLHRAEQMIKSGERKPIALLQSVRTRWVNFSEIEDLAGAARFFDNINTPQDYDRIVKERR